MSVFYNDNDAYCAQWLRNLGDAGLLPVGFVDERSILDIAPSDLAGYEQCHFFAGIGGWPYALQLAGWHSPVWTGSCPCQPLSVGGHHRGHADQRHLWPAFYALIAECRPATIFGEQVASKDGREWLAGVRADLEHLGYAVGGADLCAASVGAPHIRQRLFWVADANQYGSQRENIANYRRPGTDGGGADGRMGIAQDERYSGTTPTGWEAEHWAEQRGETRRLGESNLPRSQGCCIDAGEHADQRSPWATGEFISCLDGKARRIEPAIFPLAYGISNRVGLLRGAGNAIVPQVAAQFVSAFLEIIAKSEERTSALKDGGAAS